MERAKQAPVLGVEPFRGGFITLLWLSLASPSPSPGLDALQTAQENVKSQRPSPPLPPDRRRPSC